MLRTFDLEEAWLILWRAHREYAARDDGARGAGIGADLGRRVPHDPGTAGAKAALQGHFEARQDVGEYRGVRARSTANGKVLLKIK